MRQTDGAGNPRQAAELTFTLDTVAALPGYALHSQAREHYPDAGNGFRGGVRPFHTGSAVNDRAWIQVALEGGAESWTYSVDGGATYLTGGSDGRIELSSWTTEGTHEIRVRQHDAAGNSSADQAFNVTVNLTAAQVVGQDVPPTLNATGQIERLPGFDFTTNEAAQICSFPSTRPTTAARSVSWTSGASAGSRAKPAASPVSGWRRELGAVRACMPWVAEDRAGNSAVLVL